MDGRSDLYYPLVADKKAHKPVKNGEKCGKTFTKVFEHKRCMKKPEVNIILKAMSIGDSFGRLLVEVTEIKTSQVKIENGQDKIMKNCGKFQTQNLEPEF